MAPPTKAQQLRNKLQRIHKKAIETRLDFLEELSDNIPDIYKAMMGKAKGTQPTTDVDGNTLNGNYKAQKDLFDTWLNFTTNTDEAIKWLEDQLARDGVSNTLAYEDNDIIGLSLVR